MSCVLWLSRERTQHRFIPQSYAALYDSLSSNKDSRISGGCTAGITRIFLKAVPQLPYRKVTKSFALGIEHSRDGRIQIEPLRQCEFSVVLSVELKCRASPFQLAIVKRKSTFFISIKATQHTVVPAVPDRNTKPREVSPWPVMF
ncbi:hypothetical protein V2G26_005162 [Clonostachys chloroleuca]